MENERFPSIDLIEQIPVGSFVIKKKQEKEKIK